MPGKSKFQISRSLDEKIKRIIIGISNEHDSEFSEVNSAFILGFNYGNVTNCVGLTSNYQLHHAVFPVVGLVFFKSSPTDDDIKSSLKSIKEYSSSPNGLGSFKSDKNEHLFLIYSVDSGSNEVEKRIFNFTKGTFVRRRRLRLNVLNDPFCPRQVHRGSEDLFNLGENDSLSGDDDDQIDHLIFFIHGVGGVCDVRFRSCAEVVADFKKMANNLLAQQSPPSSGASTPSNKHLSSQLKKGFFRKNSDDSNNSRKSSSATDEPSSSSAPAIRMKRVECLPVSWHSCTRRQTGLTEQFNLIALSSVPKLRHFLHKVVLDALLYSSGPVYNQTIMNNVGDEINRLYTLFMEKHPNFKGSISLAGHSLGAVILFDLLSNQIPFEPEIQQKQQQTSQQQQADHQESPTSTHRIETKVDDSNNGNNEGGGTNISNEQVTANSDNLGDSNEILSTTSTNKLENCRRNCRNVSHEHNDFTPSESQSCLDFKNIDELLKDMNLTQYNNLFHKEHIDLNTLLLLTDVDMKELNLSLGARRKLGTYINFKKVSLTTAAIVSQNTNNSNSTDNTQQLGKQSTSTSGAGVNSEIGSNYSGNINNEVHKLLDNMTTGQYLIKYPQLKFKPRCFFAFGSPVPMFLNVRGIQNVSKDFKLPTCDRMFNIFHPYDPLAYRMEPLIDERFKNVEPVQIPHHRGGKRIHVQIREGFARVGHDIKHRLFGSLRDTWCNFTRLSTVETPEPCESTSVNSSPGSRRRRFTMSPSSSIDVGVKSNIENDPNANRNINSKSNHNYNSTSSSCKHTKLSHHLQIVRSQSELTSATSDCTSITIDSTGPIDQQPQSQQHQQSDQALHGANSRKQSETNIEFDLTSVGRLNGGRRLDYVLQEKPIELFNEYIFAFTSHANYWQNEDSALIILNEIYQVDNIQMFDYAD